MTELIARASISPGITARFELCAPCSESDPEPTLFIYHTSFSNPNGGADPQIYFGETPLATQQESALYMQANFTNGGGWLGGGATTMLWCIAESAPTFTIYQEDQVTEIPVTWTEVAFDGEEKCYSFSETVSDVSIYFPYELNVLGYALRLDHVANPALNDPGLAD